RTPAAMGTVGDRVWIHNVGNGRIDYITFEGEVVSSQRLPAQGGGLFHMVSAGPNFFGATLDRSRPLIHFPVLPGSGEEPGIPPAGTVFGHEVAARAEELFPGAWKAQLLRLATIDDRIWVM